MESQLIPCRVIPSYASSSRISSPTAQTAPTQNGQHGRWLSTMPPHRNARPEKHSLSAEPVLLAQGKRVLNLSLRTSQACVSTLFTHMRFLLLLTLYNYNC